MALFGTRGPSAKLADGRLILSLPDAETPALWVMDLEDAATSVLRLEADRQGFYVIKKHGGKGAAETIAVYRDRKSGTRALDRATHALEKARNTRSGGGQKSSRILVVLLILTVIHVLRIDQYALERGFLWYYSDEIAQISAQQAAAAAPPAPASTAAGVPVSADDFLKNQIQ